MIPSSQKILDHISAADYRPSKLKELARDMGVGQDEYRDFRHRVKEMTAEGTLIRGRQNRYASPRDAGGIVGRLKVHRKGFAFVVGLGSQGDVFVPRGDLNDALDGDTVRVELNGRWSREGLPQGEVVQVVEEGKSEYVGALRRRGKRWIVDPDDRAMDRDIFVAADEVAEIPEGYRVVVRVVERRSGYDGLRGRLVEVLGDPRDPALDFDTVIRRFDLPLSFSQKAVDGIADITRNLDRETHRRRDFRSMPCFTIDPQQARDHDDAVAIERDRGGGYRLVVHIADVSHFVDEGGTLDGEAFERGTSVYLVNRVIHMLPEELAADRCSLVPGQDRLALSVEIKLGQDGEVVSYELVESVIRSAARFSYEQVQGVLDDNMEAAGEAKEWSEALLLMAELSRKRAQIRALRGSLELDLPEPAVNLDAGGRVLELGRYPRYESNRIIEGFMLVANECVGRFCNQRNLPVLYRVHLPPKPQKLDELFELIPFSHERKRSDDNLQPRDFQKLLEQAKGSRNAALLGKLLLRSLSRAEYMGEDRGHFGLACNYYLHFTSPIRRYPDLLVHRAVKAELNGRRQESIERRIRDRLTDWGKHCSARERRATEAERTFVKIKQMRYMEGHLGEEFEGVVSGVLRGGFFVEVSDFLVDGFCFARDLDDRYEFDKKKHRLLARRSGRTIQLGMPVRVIVVAVDWTALEMDLLLSESTKAPAKGKRKKNRGKEGRKKSK